jgi:hypothetical protein
VLEHRAKESRCATIATPGRDYRSGQPLTTSRPSPEVRHERNRIEPAIPTFDGPSVLDLLCEVIRRVDALTYAAEQHFERYGWRCIGADEDDGDERPLDHLAHLLSAARESTSAAVSLGATIAAELVKHGGAA